ncbi:phosphonate ABC transporter ATP-binding protein [Sediminicoccus rosea]|uniref:ATP-binding cassette domain-containing protein n=1 Tax=Sediminicoccus rosea TaxID=1225128 RepID=A0ABZ0PMI0_9PROT|nr:ATP-binding cassette domain-containing protein [Sediminicoccus rosea]WPB86436.1 ATP-binding cassette domain-containing protein [Sediminicoccus rosea]
MLRADPGLVVRGLSATLGGRAVLRDVALDVSPGELVALTGASGAGKTTLLRAIAGLLVARGTILVAGPPALVFQQHALANRLSARDNVLVGGLGRIGFWRAAFRLWPRADIAAAEACLDRVGLGGLGARRADRLSGGQRQRVAIARALHQRARILLADEPVASLDPALAEEVVALLRDLARRDGLAVLVSLHQHDLARRFADRLLHLENGCLKIS